MSLIKIDAEDESGRVFEVLVDRAEVPLTGDYFFYEGQTLRRIPSVPQRARVKQYEFKGWSLPRKAAAVKQGRTLAPHYDERGVPVFTSRREMSEYVSAVNDNPNEGVQIQWDPDGNE